MALRIYNTMSREKELFEPLEPGKATLYVCGITPYAPSHVGHARSAVAFDVVYRWLCTSHLVTFVRNYTDVEDKIIKAANTSGESTRAVSERYIAQYEADMALLGNAKPNVAPRVTEHMPEIIDIVKRLVERGLAYVVEGDVYFDVTRFPAYGKLSGRSLAELEAGARVEVDPRKRSPYDFALWKSAKPGEPSWDSPWGPGRPGWHIECSAMAAKYLGQTFDLHGGGRDLIFPHHENEIAQTCGASGLPVMAQIWMHNGFVNLVPDKCPKCGADLHEGETACRACGYVLTEDELKMAKSKGNVFTIRDVVTRYEAEAVRLFMLMSHYRAPINYSPKPIEDAERRLDKTYETLREIRRFVGEQTFTPGKSFAATFGFDPRERFKEAMDDDFNTARAIAELSEVFKIANDLIKGDEQARLGKMISPADTSRLLGEVQALVRELGGVLGLWQQDPDAYLERRKLALSAKLPLSPAQIEALINERAQARQEKNYKRGDEIRDQLRAKGIVLKDGPKGTEWYAVED